jgi:coproporphyrinogen III oxidase-like Fe-S oxidoreductase
VPLKDQAAEYLMMGLRLSEGLDRPRYEALAGAPLSPRALGDLQDMGMIVADADRIRATANGRAVLNAVIRELML